MHIALLCHLAIYWKLLTITMSINNWLLAVQNKGRGGRKSTLQSFCWVVNCMIIDRILFAFRFRS